MPISLVEPPDSPSSSLIYLGCQSGACSTAPGVLLRNALTPQVHSTRLLTAVLVILLVLLYSSTPSWSNFLPSSLRLRPDTQPDCTRARTRSRPPRTTREARGRIRHKQAVSSYLRPELHESHHKARGRFQEKIKIKRSHRQFQTTLPKPTADACTHPSAARASKTRCSQTPSRSPARATTAPSQEGPGVYPTPPAVRAAPRAGRAGRSRARPSSRQRP